mmetsp:Transcript_7449/g.19039  ORF Transcript_7449/g.19039 Transcript_7449/m.19039 type:complete len:86 (+) Transcript_7449:3-260(+)
METSVSGGARALVPTVARMAAAVGVDGFFIETHDRPSEALSDAAVQWPLDELEPLVRELVDIAHASRWAASPHESDDAAPTSPSP